MSKELITRETCNELQKKFLNALHSEEVIKASPRQRFRTAASLAGYAETTSIDQIIRPIQHLIIDEANNILARSSISAAWVLQDVVDGEAIELMKSAQQLRAAEQILDRVIPKKAEEKKSQAPLVQIFLPSKDNIKTIEVQDE